MSRPATVFDRAETLKLRGDQLQVNDLILQRGGFKAHRLLAKMGESDDGSIIYFASWSQTSYINVMKTPFSVARTYAIRRVTNPAPVPVNVQALLDELIAQNTRRERVEV